MSTVHQKDITNTPTANTPESKLSRQDQHDFIVKQGLSEAEHDACEQFQANVDALFIRIKKKYNLSNAEMATILYPYVKSAEEVSKICSTNKNRKDKRHYRLEGLPALFYVFAESIDDLLLFECEQRPGFIKIPTAVSGSASHL